MAQATIRGVSRRRAEAAAAERILAGLSTISRSFTQVRLHEQLLGDAGVRVDRGGAALLSKLLASTDGSLRVTALADRLGVDTPTVTRKIQQLERLGLVARDADPDDRRAHRIRLTPDGRETLDRLTAAKRRWLAVLLEGWSTEDRTTFAELLGAFADRLQLDLESARVD
jgi:DNA-binding MarR family transcriptional regulator